MKVVAAVMLTLVLILFCVGTLTFSLTLITSQSDVGVLTGVLLLGLLVAVLLSTCVEGVRHASSWISRWQDR